jgi:ABC-2 type transport system permease protein
MTAVLEAAPAVTRPRTGSRDLAGTGILLRLALRRDRVLLPSWLFGLVIMVVSVENSLHKVYKTAADRADVAHDTNTSSSMRALYGPIFNDSYGGLTMWRVGGYLCLLAAIMSVLVVVRHTREEEETGRQEALSSGMVGRRAPLTAALVTVGIANAIVFLLYTALMVKADQPAAGAVAFAAGVALTGTAFGAIAAVLAQVTENTRVAKGSAIAVVALAFVLRDAGNAAATGGDHPMVWISPFGWAQQVRPFADERWWVLLLPIVLTAVGIAVAYLLTGRRDIGAGFVAPRAGPPNAPASLTGAYGLAWRLQRGTFLAWAAGFAFAGALFGSIADGADDLVGKNDQTRKIVERMGGHQSLTDSFLATLVGLLGLICVIFATAAVLRLRSEETEERAEPVLANAVGRLRWAAGHLVVAYVGTLVVLGAGGLTMGLSYGIAADDVGGQVPRVLGAALAQAPAVWILTGLGVLVFGALPRLTAAVWGLVAIVIGIGWVGPALDLPQGVLDVSPFGHLPKLPGADFTAAPYLWLLSVSVILPVAGLAALRRRDMGA